MAYKNKKKQKTHVKKLHEEFGYVKPVKKVKSVPVTQNETFVVTMPGNKYKTSWLDRILSSWM